MKTLMFAVLALAAAGLCAPAALAAESGPTPSAASAGTPRPAAPAAHRKARHHHHRKAPRRAAVLDRARVPPPPPPVETAGVIATQPKADHRPKP
jgi:hypothetical protein